MAAPTVLDLLKELNEPVQVAEVEERFKTALAFVESKCGPLTPREITKRVHADSTGFIALPVYPAVSIVSATSVSSGAEVDVSGWDVDYESGFVRGASAGTFRVTYEAGWVETPHELRLAVLLLGAHLWETRRGRASRPFTHGGMADAGAPAGFTGYFLPNRVKELMNGFLMIAAPA